MTDAQSVTIQQSVIRLSDLVGPEPSVVTWTNDHMNPVVDRVEAFLKRADARGLRACGLFGDGIIGPTHAVVEAAGDEGA